MWGVARLWSGGKQGSELPQPKIAKSLLPAIPKKRHAPTEPLAPVKVGEAGPARVGEGRERVGDDGGVRVGLAILELAVEPVAALLVPVAGPVAQAGSAAPTICPRGYYCVAGLAAPMPCPIGTFGNASALRRSEAAWKSNLLNLDSLCGDPREEKHTRPSATVPASSAPARRASSAKPTRRPTGPTAKTRRPAPARRATTAPGAPCRPCPARRGRPSRRRRTRTRRTARRAPRASSARTRRRRRPRSRAPRAPTAPRGPSSRSPAPPGRRARPARGRTRRAPRAPTSPSPARRRASPARRASSAASARRPTSPAPGATTAARIRRPGPSSPARTRAGQESDMPNFKGSDLGHVPLVSADFWTSDHLSARSRSVDVVSVTRARETLTLKRR